MRLYHLLPEREQVIPKFTIIGDHAPQVVLFHEGPVLQVARYGPRDVPTWHREALSRDGMKELVFHLRVE